MNCILNKSDAAENPYYLTSGPPISSKPAGPLALLSAGMILKY